MARTPPAIILAAGASERLGQAKALLPLGEQGTPLVGLVASRLSQAGANPIVIVTRAELSVDIMLACPDTRVVVNPNPEDGRTGSVQVGLLALSEEGGRVPKSALIVPIDRPGWSIQTARKLMQSDGCICPQKDGRGAHPLRLGKAEVKMVLASSPETPLRQLVKPVKIDVDDEFLHLNIDQPQDLPELNLWANA